MKTIAILAGNPRISLENGALAIDSQTQAFAVALEHAAKIRSRVARVAIAIDHPGIFRREKSFFDEELKLSNSAKKHLRLSALHPSIKERYQQIVDFYSFSLDDIHVITEDTCRADLVRMFGYSDEKLFRTRDPIEFSFCSLAGRQPGETKATCKSITAAIIHKLASEGVDEVITYWEFDPMRCDQSVIDPGIRLALDYLLVKARVRRIMVFNSAESVYVREETMNPAGDGKVTISSAGSVDAGNITVAGGQAAASGRR